ncbi:uncharacterized protein LOC127095089 [Lathyrus oleraceus]|uniref:uncharacterized protein LOC127095089 n=1 Tax=Pisum sativum TaxID=3888 RepID=UPI0021D0F3CC|nr:uncharacterized protein LOC127095089 [Pisum sativum]
MHFNSYIDHRKMIPFDEIVLYSGWLACELCLTAHHLPECVMRKFDYTQTIPRHPNVSSPPALTCRQMGDIFDDYESHLVLEEAQSTIAPSDWRYVNGYIRWFLRVSRLYMMHATPGDTLRPAHREILEEEQVLYAIMMEARAILTYRRQRQRMGGLVAEELEEAEET